MSNKISLGLKLRMLRRERNLTQRDLAKLADISVNSISLVERGEISPSVATLQNLATAFNIRVSYFFEDDAPPQIIHLKANEFPAMTNNGTTIMGMGKKLPQQEIELFFIKIAPHLKSEVQRVVHLGHEFVYCLRGTVMYEVRGCLYELNKGDCLLFEATLPHAWQNSGEEEAELLLVLHVSPEFATQVQHHFINYPSLTHLG